MVFPLALCLNTFVISQILKTRVQKEAKLLFHENECPNNVSTKYFKKKCIVLISMVFQNFYGRCQIPNTKEDWTKVSFTANEQTSYIHDQD